jgi:8-oxo-dGTP diphosphatase
MEDRRTGTAQLLLHSTVTKATSSREYPDRPIVGVGAVIVEPEKRRVVLVRRAAAPLAGEWSLPGGVVELGEALRAAVAREAVEETGLVVEVGEVLEVVDRIITQGDGRTQYHYVLIDFLCHARGGRLQAGGDAREAVWAGANGLANFGLEKPAIEVIRKAFARSEGE